MLGECLIPLKFQGLAQGASNLTPAGNCRSIQRGWPADGRIAVRLFASAKANLDRFVAAGIPTLPNRSTQNRAKPTTPLISI